ncbi:MAG: hypothetical protein R3D59_14800 [Paracoccaceae bacterium]
MPLFRETEIAGRLIRRLDALDYPRELLDICLVVEADDRLTARPWPAPPCRTGCGR